MASGYEKADVGNPAGGEWKKPTRVGSAILTTVAVGGSGALWFGQFSALWALVFP
jgi:hypothetical protein